ncbi:tetratricopeptide repeat protein [Candidatus Micrarchaeota archaeon]|nr:tetratricopeptide repeat protein [Candidatus Micrarchaeota archaeon]
MDDKLVEGKLEKCTALYDYGLCRDALACYNEVVSFKPECGVSYYLKGMCLYRLGKFQEAVDCFDKSVGLDRDEQLPHQAKGICLMRLKKFEDAIQSFKKALHKKPRDVETMFLIACCFLFLEDEQSAREWVDISRRFDPMHARGMLQLFFEIFVLGSEELSADEKEVLKATLQKIEERKKL